MLIWPRPKSIEFRIIVLEARRRLSGLVPQPSHGKPEAACSTVEVAGNPRSSGVQSADLQRSGYAEGSLWQEGKQEAVIASCRASAPGKTASKMSLSLRYRSYRRVGEAFPKTVADIAVVVQDRLRIIDLIGKRDQER